MDIYENWFAIATLGLWIVTVGFTVWYEFYCERVHDRQKRRSRERLKGSEWEKFKSSQLDHHEEEKR